MERLSLGNLKRAVKILKGMNLAPKCDDHKPASYIEDGIRVTHCRNCGFTAYSHPDQ